MRILKKRTHLAILALWMTLVWISSVLAAPLHAEVHAQTDKTEPNILVVYSSSDGEINEHHRNLDMLLGHFTTRLRFKASGQVEATDLEWSDAMFYYGDRQEFVPQRFVQMVQAYDKPMMAIGYNVEQLGERFSYIEPLAQPGVIDTIVFHYSNEKSFTFTPKDILNVKVATEHTAITIISGNHDEAVYPLLIRNGRDYYFAFHQLYYPYNIAMAEGLHDVFTAWGLATEHQQLHQGYIRLEDIHPLADPNELKAIADILYEKGIPYMVAVIPVYTNPKTGKQYYFSNFPEMIKILRYMQDRGGSIILHGYTHQFRLSETGEGFEFWDVEYNLPIYHEPDEEFVIKTREDFASQSEYEQYMDELRRFERNYIEERLTKGIHELANYGLYPLAFEAPHYTMSQHGYELTAQFFSTYSGQLQVSDKDWEEMASVPYITKPTFLRGMTLLSETIGYVVPNDPEAISEMVQKAHACMLVRDGLVAGFYHPYLGKEKFLELLEALEPLDIQWIDLKKMDNHVRSEYVDIQTENGQWMVRVDKMGLFFDSFRYLEYHIRRLTNKLVWGLAAVALAAVLMFISNIFYLRFHRVQMERGERFG